MRVGKTFESLARHGFLLLVFVMCFGFVSYATESNSETMQDSYYDDDTQTEITPDAPTDDTKEEDVSVKNGWTKDKTCYYVNNEKVTGVYKIDGKLYYFKKNGAIYRNKGLRKIDNKYYYVNKDNSLRTGVVKVGKQYYYFRKKLGSRYEKTGIHKVDGKYYYFSSEHDLKSGWKRNKSNKKYYFDTKTFAAKTGWNYVGKYKFYFNKKGQLLQDVRKKLTKKQKQSYYIRVNRTACCVTVYAKDGKRGYTIPVVSFICSTGGATPVGTFPIRDKLRWHELMGPCWGQWCEHLTSTILFHSVPYNSPYNNRSLDVRGYNKLGTMASHGCIRLTAGDAKWIYDNCAVGTKVNIYNNDKDPGPFDKPTAQKLNAGHTWDPTDPTIK